MGPRTARSRSLLLLVPLLALALLGSAASPALAQAVGCGAVLTQDTTLAADLIDCPGDGLVIGADGITVDLGGHVVDGLFPLGGAIDQSGIDNSAGHDGVTVRNGTVREFARGVHLASADRNRVLDLQLASLDLYGILLEGGSGNRFTGNAMDGPGDVGVAVFGAAGGPSQGNQVLRNRIDGANVAGVALQFRTITGTVIEDNDISDTVGGGSDAGIFVAPERANVRDTQIRRNRLHDNSDGVVVGGSATGTVVEGNTLVDNSGASIETGGDRTLIRFNTVDSTWAGGMAEFGIRVEPGARDTRAEANAISRFSFLGIDDSGRGTVIALNVLDGQVAPDFWTGILGGIAVRPEARHTRVQGNVVRRLQGGGFLLSAGITVAGDDVTVLANAVTDTRSVGADGIRVEPDAARVLVRGNLASRHADDGIDVDSPATTITANVANDNGDYGIEAVPGVTDGGGNRASGNGNPAQCLGVTCS